MFLTRSIHAFLVYVEKCHNRYQERIQYGRSEERGKNGLHNGQFPCPAKYSAVVNYNFETSISSPQI